MRNRFSLVVFSLVCSIYYLRAQTDISNYYEFYAHNGQLSQFYIKKYLPIKGLCSENVCGYDLVSTAYAEAFSDGATYNFLVTLVHSDKLSSDFYLLTTYDKVTNKLLDRLFVRKYHKKIPNSYTTLYGDVELNYEKLPTLTLKHSSDKTVFGVIPQSNVPEIAIKTLKKETYKISLVGKFVKIVGGNKPLVEAKIETKKLEDIKKMDIQKLVLVKNEILARYNFDFGDAKINDYFIKNFKDYTPIAKDINKIPLIEQEKQIVKMVDDILLSKKQSKGESLKPKEKKNETSPQIIVPKVKPTKSVVPPLTTDKQVEKKIIPESSVPVDSVRRKQIKSLEVKKN